MDTKTETPEARRATLLQEAARRGVKPIANIDDLHGDFWDVRDEATEDFDTWLRRTRAEGDDVRLDEGREAVKDVSMK
ncbi:MAG: hypothetical protein MSG64_19045 [Pyrinomonadaceae bacterium MAG19_C2-C3]|nr:hypothetical protein [Pyrinomonadaceae bacterium MAG19_C2-C3]